MNSAAISQATIPKPEAASALDLERPWTGGRATTTLSAKLIGSLL